MNHGLVRILLARRPNEVPELAARQDGFLDQIRSEAVH